MVACWRLAFISSLAVASTPSLFSTEIYRQWPILRGSNPPYRPRCPNMIKIFFIIPGFKPIGDGGLRSGNLTVHGCSNVELGPVQGNKSLVLFLHGAGNSADSYARRYLTHIYRPDGYNILFLQSPRSGSEWMRINMKYDLNHHWIEDDVEDNMVYLSSILDQLADQYGGHDRIWIAGLSERSS